MPHDAFISYNQRADIDFAPKLQSALQTLAKPWWRYRALTVFRDESDLGAASSLTEKIQAALAGSRFFILLASPGAAASPWVAREIETWFARPRGADFDPARNLLIARTDGEIAWDEAAREFDWTRTTALPRTLQGRFEAEPLWIDLRQFKSEAQLTLRHPEFARTVARLAAPLRGTTPAALIDDDLRRNRQARRVAYAAVAAIAVSAVGAGWGWRSAFDQAERAEAAARRAEREAARAREEEGKAKRALEMEAAERVKAQTNEARFLKELAREHYAREDDERGDALLIEALPRRTPAGASRPDVPDVAAVAGERLIASSRRVLVLHGHAGKVVDASFAPDGMRVVTASHDGSAAIWDAATGRRLLGVDPDDSDKPFYTASLSPSGAHLVTTEQERVRVWDAATGKERAAITVELRASAALDRGERFLVIGDGAKLRVFETATWRETRVRESGAGRIASFAISDDGKLVLAAAGKAVRIWELETGREIAVLEGHGDAVAAASFDAEGRRVVTASADKTARIWDVASGKVLAALEGHDGQLKSAIFAPGGKRVLTASGTDARVWDAASGRMLVRLSGHSLIGVAAFNRDGTQILTSGVDTARVWDAETGKAVAVLRGHSPFKMELHGGDFWTLKAAFSPDGARVVTASVDRTARIWDIARSRAAVLARSAAGVYWLRYSPDGRRLVTAGGSDRAEVWDVASRRRIAVLEGHEGLVHTAVFDKAGARIVTASYDKTARVFDAETGRALAVMRGHTELIWEAAFTADGARIVTASEDGTARIWDAASGRELQTLLGHDSVVTTVAVSADGRRIATASSDETVRLWNAANGREVAVLRPRDGVVVAVRFSPDSRLVATAGARSAVVWNAEDGHALLRLRGHGDRMLSLAFAPDGKRIATASRDSTARIWDAATGRLLHVLRGHAGLVATASFSPDGRLLATSGNAARLWDTATGREIAPLRGTDGVGLGAEFSPDGRMLATAIAGAVRLWHVPRPMTATDPAALLALRVHQSDLLATMAALERANAAAGDDCEAQAAHPFDPALRGKRGVAVNTKPAEAVHACMAALAKRPGDLRTRALLARAHLLASRPADALPHLDAAAKAGDAMAQFLLGEAYEFGNGVNADGAVAARHYRQALAGGVFLAGNRLAHLLWSGDGVPQDRARALALWREAAATGLPFALESLAWLHLDGAEGIPADAAAAAAHFALATRFYDEAGFMFDAENARVMRGNLAQNASIAELQDVLRRIEAWKPAPARPR